MRTIKRFRGMLYFLAGVAVTLVVMFGFFYSQDAQADQYSCIRNDLKHRGMSGNIPDPQFVITYAVPSCYAENGYTATEAFMHSGEVAVRYKKK
jgi:hypothetical protein